MKRVHLKNDSDLFSALLVLKEDAAEKARQEKMAGRLRKRKMNEKDEEDENKTASKKPEKEAGSENKNDEEGKTPEKEEPKKSDSGSNDDKLPGAERLENSVLPPGKSPTSKDIAQRVNFIRAGASLKDPEIQRSIAVWISQLRNPERLAAYTTLDALAQIVLAGKSPAEAPTYVDPAGLTIKGGENSSPPAKEKTTSSTESIPKKSSGPVPITVGEGVVKKLKEVDVPVRSGKLVPFGSKSHIDDLTQRIDDLRRIRSYQERGSDTHHALGVAIVALKKQLNSANKKATSGNPRTQPVPPLVEKEK